MLKKRGSYFLTWELVYDTTNIGYILKQSFYNQSFNFKFVELTK